MTRRVVRAGRPPRQLAGEVDARILDAARHVFLERGLGNASMEEIAGRARAGKPTVYARFASKEALFATIVMKSVEASIGRFARHVPIGTTVDERLADVAVTILRWALAGDTVGLLRLTIAEAGRLPTLASNVHRMVRERATDAVARLLRDAAQSDELGALPAFAPRRLTMTTRFFLDLVLLPLFVRALYGEKLKPLQAEIEPHVARCVVFFLAACRHGGVARDVAPEPMDEDGARNRLYKKAAASR